MVVGHQNRYVWTDTTCVYLYVQHIGLIKMITSLCTALIILELNGKYFPPLT
jgi:hypothetical protein